MTYCGVADMGPSGAAARTKRLTDVAYWPIASFRCATEFGRYRGIADSGKPSARQIYEFTA